jgi:hypothetical protein
MLSFPTRSHTTTSTTIGSRIAREMSITRGLHWTLGLLKAMKGSGGIHWRMNLALPECAAAETNPRVHWQANIVRELA